MIFDDLLVDGGFCDILAVVDCHLWDQEIHV